MFDSTIFEKIRSAWIADQNHPLRGCAEKPVPAIKVFQELIETAYVASLKLEERRFNKLSITYIGKEDLDSCIIREEISEEGLKYLKHNSSVINGSLIKFEKPFDFNGERIAKLAAICDPKINSIAITSTSSSEESSECLIVGLFFFHPFDNYFNSLPHHMEGYSQDRPDLLMIIADGLGSLTISRGDFQIGRFIHGSFEPALPTRFYSHEMGDFIQNILVKSSLYIHEKHWFFYLRSIDFILKEASNRGHGASILFIPEGHQDCLKFIDIKYKISDILSIHRLLDECSDAECNNESLVLGYKKYISERLKFVSQLTCMDGALLLTNSLQVISFGAHLNAPDWKGKVLIAPDGFGGGGGDFHAKGYGTRHNSVISFIGAVEDCFGFVISEDGPIRGFIKKDHDTIYCWPDCTVSMSMD